MADRIILTDKIRYFLVDQKSEYIIIKRNYIGEIKYYNWNYFSKNWSLLPIWFIPGFGIIFLVQ